MVTEFRFPDVGEGITEGELVKWLVEEGEKVKQDQSLAEVETDKAVVELPAPATGTILKLHVKNREKIKVGQILVSIGEPGEKVKKTPAITEAKKEIPQAKPKVCSVETASTPTPTPVHTPQERGDVLAMPHTRKLARMLGVNIKQVPGTGPGGRISDEDVKRFNEKKTTPSVSFVASKQGGQTIEAMHGREERVPLRGIRKAIAENLSKSFRTTVPVSVMDEVDVSKLWELRKKENEKLKGHDVHLTFLPFVIKACLIALEKYSYFNASIDDIKQEIVLKHYYHIGIAVETEEGLMVPVIKNADNKSMVEIAIEIQELATEARERKIRLEDLKGSSFSITNYGSIGGRFGTPVINHPNVAILGLGKIQERAVVREGKIVVRRMFPVSLTFDHRIVDGAQASLFLEEILKHLEDPGLLLIDSF
ncbi:2-oxo acid dehydrogenase subunit E2 [Candidatus Micrarchaeota archaeon]|nr:2-oxo acid dehydrogenase subunit E2 [Candidatus Micrarchaeota archaeon]MBU1930180.1 2-oxo acid dehydrogenase subunit E2 [Candidatus Micrarchaeota archaeon]